MTFRGSHPGETENDEGPQLWKGQNIVTGGFVGEPLVHQLDFATSDDFGLLRYKSALPERGWVFPQIMLAPCCAPTLHSRDAFDNTVTLFFPNTDAQGFPFDLLVASRVYTWLYAVGFRMGLLARSNGRSHLYAANLRALPIPYDLAETGRQLEDLRTEFTTACVGVTHSLTAMLSALRQVQTTSLRDAVRLSRTRLNWSDAFDRPTTLVAPSLATLDIIRGGHGGQDESFARIHFGDLFTYVEVDDLDLANRVMAAFAVLEGPYGRVALLNTLVPSSAEILIEWEDVLGRFTFDAVSTRFENVLMTLDRVVAASLGLSKTMLRYIDLDLRSDPVLQLIKPRLPGAEPRAQALIASLKSRKRYQS